MERKNKIFFGFIAMLSILCIPLISETLNDIIQPPKVKKLPGGQIIIEDNKKILTVFLNDDKYVMKIKENDPLWFVQIFKKHYEYGKINYSWNHLDQVNMEYNNEDSTLKLEIYKHINDVSYVYTFSQIDQSVYEQIDELLKQNVYPFEFWKKKEGEDTKQGGTRSHRRRRPQRRVKGKSSGCRIRPGLPSTTPRRLF